jgi:hypothetical protein
MVLLVATLAGHTAAAAEKAWEVYGRDDGMVGDEVISMDLSDGVLWVATTWSDPNATEPELEGGVSTVKAGNRSFTTYRPNDGLAHKKVWVTLIDGDRVWFGTFDGLSMLDTDKLAELGTFDVKEAWTTFTFKLEDKQIAKDIYSLALQGDTLWFGSNLGLGSMNTDSYEWVHYGVEDGLPGKKVQAIAEDGNLIWAGTDQGLARFDREKEEFTVIDIPSEATGGDVVTALAADDESVWVGTRAGLHAMNKATEQWTPYVDEIPGSFVQEIAVRDGEVWIGTIDGVGIYDKEKDKWKVMDEGDGLASNDVREIRFQGEDYIWIGTAKGLVRHYPAAVFGQIIQIIIIAVVVALIGIAIVVAKIKFFTPSPEEIERRQKVKEIRQKRKEKSKKGKPPWEVCGGQPKKELCSRCKYNSVKAGKLHCSKYNIDLE